jgi:hypothetical protein
MLEARQKKMEEELKAKQKEIDELRARRNQPAQSSAPSQPSYSPPPPRQVQYSCRASGARGAYGFSHSYSSQSGAESRALSECSARGSNCSIVSCSAS